MPSRSVQCSLKKWNDKPLLELIVADVVVVVVVGCGTPLTSDMVDSTIERTNERRRQVVKFE